MTCGQMIMELYHKIGDLRVEFGDNEGAEYALDKLADWLDAAALAVEYDEDDDCPPSSNADDFLWL